MFFLIGKAQITSTKNHQLVGEYNTEITTLTYEIGELDTRLKTTQTRAYADKFNKATQNNKNPWERVIVLVHPEQLKELEAVENTTALLLQDETDNQAYITATMENYQKWWYYFSKKIR